VTRVKEAIRSSYSNQSIFNITTMDEILATSRAGIRFNAFLIGGFALIALTMTGTGMYSVISCLVSQRTRDIALRVALGAPHGRIVQAVLSTTGVWVSGGLLAGIVLALATNTTIRNLSDSAIPASIHVYLIALMFFVFVGTVAIYAPVRRAIRLDPATSLRRE
jgi:ABC-type antimicrobial peptide transport system permease subunit